MCSSPQAGWSTLLIVIKHLGSFVKSLIEIFTEIPFDRFAQKLIDADLFFFALCESILADVPAVQVQSSCAVAELGYTDRIEPA